MEYNQNDSPPTSPLCLPLSRPSPSAQSTGRKNRSSLFAPLEKFHNFQLSPTPPSTPPRKRSSGTSSNRISWDLGIRKAFRKSSTEAGGSQRNSAELKPAGQLELIYRNADGYFQFQPEIPPQEDSPDMASNRASLLHPEARLPPVGKAKQIKAAEEMKKSIEDKAAKRSLDIPPYDFLELIGKGSFGRVFKSKRHSDDSIVAIKIIDVDKTDYKLAVSEKDQAVKDLANEISILTTLKEARAKNVNQIHEAFSWHSQLWIVSEYCPGGSVHTLMRANEKPGLEEKFIIPIARELAVAMKYVHGAGIIHRDIKCGNVLITQDGQVQLCDFGVSGVLEGSASKRSTIIGTPYWMAPELHEAGPDSQGYGQEIDCWAYGCTVYEMATGMPPNARIIPQRLHQVLEQAPRLEGDQFSYGLRDFVGFCLVAKAADRPDASAVQNHNYISGTSKKHPTHAVRELIARYAAWEQRGGNRVSLWQPGGAASTTLLKPFEDPIDEDEWNFSTTNDFTDDVLSRFSTAPSDDDSYTGQQQQNDSAYSSWLQKQQDSAAQRGGAKMGRLFDESAAPYAYSTDPNDQEDDSDLAFRRQSEPIDDSEDSVVDLDAARMSQDLSSITALADVSTIRAKKSNRFYDFYGDDEEEEKDEPPVYNDPGPKRSTMLWSFPSAIQRTVPARATEPRPPTLTWNMQDAQNEVMNDAPSNLAPNGTSHDGPPQRPALLHTMTEPVGQVGDFLHPRDDDFALSLEPPDRDSLVRYDLDYQTMERPLSSSTIGTEHSIMTDTTDGNPFALEEAYNDRTIKGKVPDNNRLSAHNHSQSEPTAGDRTSNGMSVSLHDRGSSLVSSIEHDRSIDSDGDILFHNRSISVKDSIDSLRAASRAEDWEEDYMSRLSHIPRDKPLLGPEPDRLSNGTWGQYEHWRPANGHSIDSDAAASMASDTDDYSDYRALPYGGPPITPTFSRRGRRHPESDADSDFDRNGYRKRPPRHPRPQPRRKISFPEARPPHPDALSDDAPPDLLATELSRLLEDLTTGLGKSTQMLKDGDRMSQSQQRSSHYPQGSGSGSGSGQDLAYRDERYGRA